MGGKKKGGGARSGSVSNGGGPKAKVVDAEPATSSGSASRSGSIGGNGNLAVENDKLRKDIKDINEKRMDLLRQYQELKKEVTQLKEAQAGNEAVDVLKGDLAAAEAKFGSLYNLALSGGVASGLLILYLGVKVWSLSSTTKSTS